MIIICRVVWAEKYNALNEKFDAGSMKYPPGIQPGELMNFANDGGYAYGFVEPSGTSISLKNFGLGNSETAVGATIIWAAVDPSVKILRVVGWYRNATIYSQPQRTTGLRRKTQAFQFMTKYSNSHLLPLSERFLDVPTRTKRADKGYIGQRNWFFPEGAPKYRSFLADLSLLMSGGSPTKSTDDGEFSEGARYTVEMGLIARNPRLVAAAKNKWGVQCQICGFDFEKRYGEIGKGFIEAHHIVPLSSNVRQTSSIDDLRVLCANCHRMVHRKNPALSLDELRALLRN